MEPLSDGHAAKIVIDLPPESFLRQYVRYCGNITDAPLAYHLGTGLTLLATTLPENFGLVYAGDLLRGNLYTMLAGRSGEERKSAAAGIGKRLLAEAAPELMGTTPGSLEWFTMSLPFKAKQLVTYSEFGSFLSRAGQPGGYFEPMKTALNDLWDCPATFELPTLKRAAKTTNPRLSILAACARPYLEAHTSPEDWTGGFMGRWLIFYARRERLYALPDREPEGRQDLVNMLSARAQTVVVGPCLGLSPKARTLWQGPTGHGGWFADISNRRLPSKIIGIRARVPTFAMKIAALLAWDIGDVMHGQTWSIGARELELAIRIVELHVQSIVALSEHLTENRDMRDRANVVFQLEEGPLEFGPLLKRSHLLAKRLREILETLQLEKRVALVVPPGEPERYALLPGGDDILTKPLPTEMG